MLAKSIIMHVPVRIIQSHRPSRDLRKYTLRVTLDIAHLILGKQGSSMFSS